MQFTALLLNFITCKFSDTIMHIFKNFKTQEQKIAGSSNSVHFANDTRNLQYHFDSML